MCHHLADWDELTAEEREAIRADHDEDEVALIEQAT